MTLDLSDFKPTPASRREIPPYPSADPSTDMRRIFAETEWSNPGSRGYPIRTTSGDWMIRVLCDVPYEMLARLEAKAGSEDIGSLIRAALVAAGYGSEADIEGIRSDRYATDEERRTSLDMPPRSKRPEHRQ